jgi:hypothetical protein
LFFFFFFFFLAGEAGEISGKKSDSLLSDDGCLTEVIWVI